MVRLFGLTTVIAAGLLCGAGCGDDGKAKLYEVCSINAPCSGDLFCFNGLCSIACTAQSDTDIVVGSCYPADDCETDVSVGCCQIAADYGANGRGNCIANPAAGF